MTYLQQLRDSLTTEHHHVPFIYRPPELVMECEFHGPIGMYQLAKQSIRNHLSLIPEYQCRLCEDQIPHEFSEGHLQYSSTYSLNDGIDLLSEHIYGCCESCSKKISKSEIDQDGNPISKGIK